SAWSASRCPSTTPRPPRATSSSRCSSRQRNGRVQPAKRKLQAQLTGNERELIEAIAEFYNDPLGFVWFAFPWGEESLKDEEPDAWQISILPRLGEEPEKRDGGG